MFGFYNIMMYNNIDICQFDIKELKKLYRYYIYLFNPTLWNFYKFIYKKLKY